MFKCKCAAGTCVVTYKYINNAWVAVITVCDQKLDPGLLVGSSNANRAFSKDFNIAFG